MNISNKKLNQKGFTLIELLAVIVILAVVLSVTIPSVLTSMATAKENSLQNAADSVSDWFSKNYELDAIGSFGGGTDAAYTSFVTGHKDATTLTSTTPGWDLTADVLTAAGISNAGKNIDVTTGKSTVYYNTTKSRVCVKLTANEGGSFFNNKDLDKNAKSSSGC